MLLLCCLAVVWNARTTTAQTFKLQTLPNQRLLPVGNVHCILEDADGFLWYGTPGGGVCRDNGFQIDVFRSDRSHPDVQMGGDVLCLCENRAARQIWVGTKSGAFIINRTDCSTEAVDASPFTLTARHIPDILCARDSTVWLVLRDSLLHFSPEGRLLGGIRSMWHGRSANPTSMTELADGRILVAQWRGGWGVVEQNDRDGSYAFRELPLPAGIQPQRMMLDQRRNCLWLGTWGDGIYRTGLRDGLPDVGTLTHFPSGASEQDRQIISIMLDPVRPLLWCVSMTGLSAYDVSSGSPQPMSLHTLGLPPTSILDMLAADREGNVWVPGFMPHTFAILSDAAVVHPSPTLANLLSGERVLRLVTDGEWAWTWADRRGLCLQNVRTGEHRPADVFGGRPVGLVPCRDGGAYVFCGHEVICVKNEGWDIGQSRVPLDGLDDEVKTLADDRRGGLYVGTIDALYHSVGGNLNLIRDDMGVILDMAVDDAQRLWAVSTRSGLVAYDPEDGRWQAWPCDELLDCVGVGRDGTVYAGSRSGTLFMLRRGDKALLAEVPEASNASGNGIAAIRTDQGGHLWLLSDQSLREWNPHTGASRLLRPGRGLEHLVSISPCASGGMCVAGGGGLVVCLHSDSLARTATGIHARVTAWQVDSCRRLTCDSVVRIAVQPSVGTVELELSTLDILHSSQIQFAWRLQGKNAEWHTLPIGANTVRLPELGKGHYAVEVRATDRWGRWNDAVVVAHIDREPAWWETWWAYILYIIVIAGGASLALWWRHRQQALLEEQERAFRAQTDELERLRQQMVELASRQMQATPESPLQAEHEDVGTGSSVPIAHGNDIADKAALSPLDEELLRKAKASVLRNMDNMAYGVDQLSSDLCMSRVNLYRRMRSLIHQSPSEYIRDQRLQRAAELLTTTNYSILAISEMTGFSSASYFTKCFRKKYGINPSKHTDR